MPRESRRSGSDKIPFRPAWPVFHAVARIWMIIRKVIGRYCTRAITSANIFCIQLESDLGACCEGSKSGQKVPSIHWSAVKLSLALSDHYEGNVPEEAVASGWQIIFAIGNGLIALIPFRWAQLGHESASCPQLYAGVYQIIFAATCMIRPGAAELMVPKEGLGRAALWGTPALGEPKLV